WFESGPGSSRTGRWSDAPAARSRFPTMTIAPTGADAWLVRHARRDELPALNAIERAAGRRFETIAWLADVPEVLAPADGLAAAEERGQVWVAAARADGTLVGFAYADVVD